MSSRNKNQLPSLKTFESKKSLLTTIDITTRNSLNKLIDERKKIKSKMNSVNNVKTLSNRLSILNKRIKKIVDNSSKKISFVVLNKNSFFTNLNKEEYEKELLIKQEKEENEKNDQILKKEKIHELKEDIEYLIKKDKIESENNYVKPSPNPTIFIRNSKTNTLKNNFIKLNSINHKSRKISDNYLNEKKDDKKPITHRRVASMITQVNNVIGDITEENKRITNRLKSSQDRKQYKSNFPENISLIKTKDHEIKSSEVAENSQQKLINLTTNKKTKEYIRKVYHSMDFNDKLLGRYLDDIDNDTYKEKMGLIKIIKECKAIANQKLNLERNHYFNAITKDEKERLKNEIGIDPLEYTELDWLVKKKNIMSKIPLNFMKNYKKK